MTFWRLLAGGISVGLGIQVGSWVCLQIQGFLLGAIQTWQRERKGEDIQRLPMCERCCTPCILCCSTKPPKEGP